MIKTNKQIIEENKLHPYLDLIGPADFVSIIKKVHANESIFAEAFLKMALPVAISTVKDGRLIDVNDKFLEFMECKRDEVIGYSCLELALHKNSNRENFLSNLDKNGRIQNYEAQFITKSGVSKHCLLNASVLMIDNENYLLSILTDITERKHLALQLDAEQQKFKIIADFTTDWVNWVGADGKPIWISPSVELITGYSVAECFAMQDFPLPIIHPFYHDKIIATRQKADKEPLINVEFRIIKKDGTIGWVALSTNPVIENGRNNGHRSSLRDISCRKQMEKELHESEEKYRLLIENSHDIIYTLNVQGVFTFVSPSFTVLLGYPLSRIIGKKVQDVVHPDDVSKCLAFLSKAIKTGKRQSGIEYRVCHEDGSKLWHTTNAVPVKDKDGAFCGYVGISSDITERKHMQDALAASEKKHRQLYESMMDAYVCVDMEGKIRDYNYLYQNMLGYDHEELASLTYKDITPEKWHSIEAKIVETQVLTRGYSEIYEKEYQRKDGTIFPVELRTMLLRDSEGKPLSMWAFIRDISERKLVEDALLKSEQKYRMITENIMDFVALVDMNGVFQYVTQSLQLLGYEPEEMIGLSAIGLTHPDDLEWIIKLHKQGIEKVWNEAVYGARFRCKDGSYALMQVRSRILTNADGMPVSCIIVGRHLDENQRGETIVGVAKQTFVGADLTLREKEILSWIMQGKSTWDISVIVKISERTIKFHVDRIMKKLSAVNRTHAVAIAMRYGLIASE